ncbi:MAG: DUF6077 domain-containing protein [Pseudomonadota bacterium]
MPSRESESSGEALLSLVPEVAVVLFACWTAAYQIVYVMRVAFLTILPLFVALMAGALCFFVPVWKRAYRSECPFGANRRVVAAVVVLGLVLALVSTILCRPDNDDVDYFHRALVQMRHLWEPVFTGDLFHNREGLPGPDSLHLVTSLEVLCAFVGHVLGVSPLVVFHNISCAAACFLLPMIYYLLYRELELTPGYSFLGTVGAMVFLLTDGNLHTSMGNYAFVRLWQGKTVVMLLLFPLVLMICSRFYRSPSVKDWAFLLTVGICAGGLSGTGLFFVPMQVFLVSMALFGAEVFTGDRPWRQLVAPAILLNLTSIWGALFSGAALAGLLPSFLEVGKAHVLLSEGLASWYTSVTSATGGGWSLAWYAFLLVMVPFTVVPRRSRILVMLIPAAAVLIFMNGLLGPVWLKVLNQIYWRVMYFLPLPLMAGLLFVAAGRLRWNDRSLMGFRVGLLTVIAATALFVLHFRMTTVSPQNRVTLKYPQAYKLIPEIVSFSEAVKDLVGGKRVLAPEDAFAVLALVNDGAKWETARAGCTKYLFSLAGMPAEGTRRVLAQQYISNMESSPDARAAFEASAKSNVDAVVVDNGCLEKVRTTLLETGDVWEERHTGKSFTLFLRQDRGASVAGARAQRQCR